MNVGALEFVSIVPWTIIVQLVNLLLLFLLLKHFLFKPIQTILDKRASEIQQDYDDASKASAEAKALREEYETRMAEAKSEASEIVKAATRKAQTHGEEIVLDARNQANRMLEKADAEIEQEKKKAMNELKNEISGIAVDIASKVVEREINEKDHEALIQEFIKGVGEASGQRLQKHTAIRCTIWQSKAVKSSRFSMRSAPCVRPLRKIRSSSR